MKKIVIFLVIFSVSVAIVSSVKADTSTTTTYASNNLCANGGYTCTNLATSTSVELSRDLWIGKQGADVYKLQQFLNQEGLFFGPFLGYYGPVTAQAVKEFQMKSNIVPMSGYFGPKTRNAVNMILRAGFYR